MAFLARLIFWLVACLALVASAHAGSKRKPRVLIVSATEYVQDVRAKLLSSGQFAAADVFAGNFQPPTLETLKAYDAVLLVNDGEFANAVTLGNTLADYVDAGGGVVNCTFSLAAVSPPSGRWVLGYHVITPTTTVVNTPASLNVASITDQNHPILIGVGSFSGGSTSFRANSTTVVAGALIVAKWSTGEVLVATGVLPGRADLNFYPPSSDARADFWSTSTDGLKLMVNALLYVMRPKVLLVHGESAGTQGAALDVQTKLRATGKLGQVDLFSATAATPTLEELTLYDAAFVWGNFPFQNASALGNVMADYVDSGGGVVSAVFETAGLRSMLGRWANGYKIIPISDTTIGAAALGSFVFPNHAILAGVNSFLGGTGSPRPTNTALEVGGLIVAKWADGKTLVATSTRFPGRVDLGFYPPSSTFGAGNWDAATDGAKIMANALVYATKPYVLCAAADAQIADVVNKLTASRRFSKVDFVNAATSSPSVTALNPYGAVFTWTNSNYASASTLGNNLAHYVDGGGAVVTGLFATANQSSLAGRWVMDGYDIIPAPRPFTLGTSQQFLGTVFEPEHPIASFVRKFDGGANSFRLLTSPPLRGRSIMNWTDGKMLASVHNFRRAVELGYWPVSNALANGWNQRTDGTWMTANAIEWAVRSRPCRGDFNGDGAVNDADFVLFVGYYNTLIDPAGDLNGDALTDDSDFVEFVSSYNELLCP